MSRVDVLLLRNAERVLAVHNCGRHSDGECAAVGCSDPHGRPCRARRWALYAADVARGVSWIRQWTARHDGISQGLPATSGHARDGDVLRLRRPNPYAEPEDPWLWSTGADSVSQDPNGTLRLPVLAVPAGVVS